MLKTKKLIVPTFTGKESKETITISDFFHQYFRNGHRSKQKKTATSLVVTRYPVTWCPIAHSDAKDCDYQGKQSVCNLCLDLTLRLRTHTGCATSAPMYTSGAHRTAATECVCRQAVSQSVIRTTSKRACERERGVRLREKNGNCSSLTRRRLQDFPSTVRRDDDDIGRILPSV